MKIVESQECTGERIREVRERMGLTQEQLAVKTGLSRSIINWAETGRHGPSLKTIYTLLDNPEFSRTFTSLTSNQIRQEFCIYPISGYSPYGVYQRAINALSDSNGVLPEELLFFETSDIERERATWGVGLNQVLLPELTESLGVVVKELNRSLKSAVIQIVSITCGFGWLEFQLARNLIEFGICQRVILSFIHSSINLLRDGLSDSAISIPRGLDVQFVPILGNRSQLAAACNLLDVKFGNDVKRLFFLQSTLMNHDDSEALFHDFSRVSRRGDLLLFDFAESQIRDIDRLSVFRTDKRFNEKYLVSNNSHIKSWVGETVLNIDKHACDIGFNQDAITDPLRYGSLALYGVNLELLIHRNNGSPSTLSGWRVYVFDTNRIRRTLGLLGWSVSFEYLCGLCMTPRMPQRWLSLVKN